MQKQNPEHGQRGSTGQIRLASGLNVVAGGVADPGSVRAGLQRCDGGAVERHPHRDRGGSPGHVERTRQPQARPGMNEQSPLSGG